MVSKYAFVATLNHGETLRQISTAFGSNPFTNAELRKYGLDLTGIGVDLHTSGCIQKIGRNKKGMWVWRLSPDLVEFYAAQGVGA